jgi:hypothetical protein
LSADGLHWPSLELAFTRIDSRPFWFSFWFSQLLEIHAYIDLTNVLEFDDRAVCVDRLQLSRQRYSNPSIDD